MVSKGDRELFKSIKPHFFKIILHQTLHDRNLVIPKKFVKKYCNDFLESVLLKVPSGDEWKVELYRSDDHACLRNGWQDFVKHYSLAHGDLLVFEYTSNSCFNVILFDKSATEIDYPMVANCPQKPNLAKWFEIEKETDDVDLIMTSDDSDTSTHHKRKGSTPTFEFARPSKAQRSVSADGSKPDETKTKKSGPFGSNKEKSTEERKLYKVSKMTWPLTEDEKAKALQKAVDSFKSRRPFFMVVLQPTYICYFLRLPYTFVKRYFKKTVGKVVLQVLGGRTWTVAFSVTHSLNQATFSSNWSVFAQDNNLKVGDVCIFELIDSTELALKVTVSKATEDANCSIPPEQSKAIVTASTEYSYLPSCSDIRRVVAATAHNFTSVNPFFKAVIRTWNIEKCSVHIPSAFMNHIRTCRVADVNLQFATRLWPVKLLAYSQNTYGLLGAGWCKFARDNGIKEGDVCIFELNQIDPLLLRVFIFKCVR